MRPGAGGRDPGQQVRGASTARPPHQRLLSDGFFERAPNLAFRFTLQACSSQCLLFKAAQPVGIKRKRSRQNLVLEQTKTVSIWPATGFFLRLRTLPVFAREDQPATLSSPVSRMLLKR